MSDLWAGAPHEQSEPLIPEGLALVRQATSLPAVVLEAWWHEQWPDPNVRDESGRTPLWWAAAEGEWDSVKALLALGADPQCAEHHQYTCARLARKTSTEVGCGGSFPGWGPRVG